MKRAPMRNIHPLFAHTKAFLAYPVLLDVFAKLQRVVSFLAATSVSEFDFLAHSLRGFAGSVLADDGMDGRIVG